MNLTVKPYRMIRTIPLALMLMTPAMNINAANVQQKADTYESMNESFKNVTSHSDNPVKTITTAVLLIMGMFGVAHFMNNLNNNKNKKNEG